MAQPHLTTKNLQKLCDILVSCPSWKSAMAQMSGASERTAFVWRAASIKAREENDTSSPLFFEWRGAYDYFHCHAGRARQENIITYEATIRDQSLNGITEAVLGPDQKPIWKERASTIGRSDDFIRAAEGLADWEDVDRLERTPDGKPVPLTKVTQLPAPLRLRILEQDRRYVERKETEVQISGEITVQKPPARLPGEPAPRSMAELKRLAALSVEARRAELGATGYPTDGKGLVAQIERAQPDAPRPSNAKPSQSLDQSGTGRGTIPDGGYKTA